MQTDRLNAAGRLGHRSFAIREKAQRELIAAGRSSLRFLRAACKERDIEVVRRAERAIDEMAAGGDQHTYELQTPVTLLGRGTDCDLRLVDPGVSRHHAELRVENGQVVLVDLSSTNGTFVNGQPVRRVALTDGTHVSLGRTTLVFHQDGQDDGQGTAYSRTTY